jgi:hypothetical protein
LSQLVVVGTDGCEQPGSAACCSPDSAIFVRVLGPSSASRSASGAQLAHALTASHPFSPMGGRPPDFVTGSFVTACRCWHRWRRPTRISSVPQSGQRSSSCKGSVLVLRARRMARSLRMRSAPVIAFSPIGGRPPDFITGSFVTAFRGRHRWTRPTRISSVPQSGQRSSSCKCSVLPVLHRTTAASLNQLLLASGEALL